AKERQYFIHGQLNEEGNVIIPGCVRNGIDEESANKIFDEMAEFAKYAFNKSHAACYAVVSYRTAYLKTYYPTEFMAAMLNSFLGNLDKIPEYVDECKRLKIEILKPDINRSYTKFTVDNGKIRFGLGSIKNVGIGAVDAIVENRKNNGEYKSFTDFCERMEGEAVNKKCIESLIKAGAFDNFAETRSTLMASFEDIIDTINGSSKKNIQGQVSMFDMAAGSTDSAEDKQDMEKLKYKYTTLKEYTDQELLSMEKEMLGIYISGHPLEKYREQIAKQTNINTLQIREAQEISNINEESTNAELITTRGAPALKDGQFVKFAGIITSVKKKYTKNNKIMAFVTVEDLYGSCEIIVFENCYMQCSNELIDENIVLVEGRLSIREDEETKIVAREIKKLGDEKKQALTINITNLDDNQKDRLRGALKFFSGDKNNIQVEIINGERQDPAGGLYVTKEILEELQEIVGVDNAKIE
ncbi:MAG: OB-fold nucleic acid binding domain-containing protein, partial [Clostridia bacterium]